MKANGIIRNVLFINHDQYHIRNILQISDERKKRVIDLYFNQHKSYAEIAQIERISPCDIHAIIKEEEARR
jgi:DNA-directed RNA polymerase specialized sigma subunit